MKTFQMIHYLWEVIKVFMPVVITIGAMFFIDRQNKKRWLGEGYLKRKIELEIKIKQKLLRIKIQIDELTDLILNDLKELSNKEVFEVDDIEILDTLNDRFIDMFYEINEIFQIEGRDYQKCIKQEYDLNLLLEEYKIFNSNVSEFQKYYNDLSTSCYWRFFKGNKELFDIAEKDLSNKKLHILVKSAYGAKIELDKLIPIFNNATKM